MLGPLKISYVKWLTLIVVYVSRQKSAIFTSTIRQIFYCCLRTCFHLSPYYSCCQQLLLWVVQAHLKLSRALWQRVLQFALLCTLYTPPALSHFLALPRRIFNYVFLVLYCNVWAKSGFGTGMNTFLKG